MQRKINQGGVVRKELWTTKRDDMGPLKRQHGHICSPARYKDDPGDQGKVIIGHLATLLNRFWRISLRRIKDQQSIMFQSKLDCAASNSSIWHIHL